MPWNTQGFKLIHEDKPYSIKAPGSNCYFESSTTPPFNTHVMVSMLNYLFISSSDLIAKKIFRGILQHLILS